MATSGPWFVGRRSDSYRTGRPVTAGQIAAHGGGTRREMGHATGSRKSPKPGGVDFGQPTYPNQTAVPTHPIAEHSDGRGEPIVHFAGILEFEYHPMGEILAQQGPDAFGQFGRRSVPGSGFQPDKKPVRTPFNSEFPA
jgi:hypothetical protein